MKTYYFLTKIFNSKLEQLTNTKSNDISKSIYKGKGIKFDNVCDKMTLNFKKLLAKEDFKNFETFFDMGNSKANNAFKKAITASIKRDEERIIERGE